MRQWETSKRDVILSASKGRAEALLKAQREDIERKS